jgi:hypothetical protein
MISKIKNLLFVIGLQVAILSNSTAQTCNQCVTNNSLSTGLVACFPFNGNANDESSNGNNGIAYANATLTTDRNSQSSKAYSFDGSATAYIKVAASSSLNTATMAGFTYSCWFNPSTFSPSAPTAYRRIFNIQDATNKNYDLSYHYQTNKLNFINFNSTLSNIDFLSNTTFSTNTWYHVVLTIDAANHPHLYVDGVLDNSSATSVVKPSSPTYTIGSHLTQPWNFAGKIDDVRVYNRALDSLEIIQLYSSDTNMTTTVIQDTTICVGDSIQLTATGGTTYSWSPSTGLSNPNIANPYAKPSSTQQYIVTISKGLCSMKDTIVVNINQNCCASCTIPLPINNDLVLCAPFSGNANDETVNGNNGTAYSNATLTTDRNGQTSKAYSFDGSSLAYINVAASSSLNTSTMTGFSYSCWFNPTIYSPSPTTAYRRIFNIQDATGKNYDLSYHYQSNKLNFINFNGTSANINFLSNTTFATGTWYHVVLTIDAANHPHLYVNGVLDNSSATAVIKPSSPTYIIGSHLTQPWNFAGKIDDVRVYNRALDSSEIISLYSCVYVSGFSKTSVRSIDIKNEHRPKIFPNPSNTGIFEFALGKTASNEDLQITVYNQIGQLVATEKYTISKNKLDISSLNHGLYFVEFNSAKTGERTIVKIAYW